MANPYASEQAEFAIKIPPRSKFRQYLLFYTSAVMNALDPRVVGEEKRAVIDTASAGDQTVVAAVGGKKLKIVNLHLVTAGSTVLTIKSGSTSLTGAMSFDTKGMVLGHSPVGYYETAVGEAFVINNSAAVQVSGALTYFEVD